MSAGTNTPRRVLLLAGDGIGHEIMAEAEAVLAVLAARGFGFEITHAPLGGTAYDLHGDPLPPATLEAARAADFVLLGAVGGPQWDGVPFDKRPERALLDLRRELGLFANLRPALCMPALAEASSLKRPLVEGLDILIVRELTGGVYFGEPRGIEERADGSRRGFNTQTYTDGEVRRVAEVAFAMARGRARRVVSVDKANVMESGLLWRQEVQKLRDEAWSDIELSHLYADNCAMQLVRAPKQFDVILTDNLFGDLLSDCAAMLTGSLGMLPSASLGAPRADGIRAALYEPVHGSAPDIAGRGVANPLAMLLSLAMALEWSCAAPEAARALEGAVAQALGDGLRTPDLLGAGAAGSGGEGGARVREVSTAEMGSAVRAHLADAL